MSAFDPKRTLAPPACPARTRQKRKDFPQFGFHLVISGFALLAVWPCAQPVLLRCLAYLEGKMLAMPTRIVINTVVFALSCIVSLTLLPAQASDSSAADRLEAAKALLRPVCSVKAIRDKVVAQTIKQGGEYGALTAKWDLDTACEQLELPVNPVHDTADRADGASHTNWIYDARWSPNGKLIATASRDGSVRLWDVATGKTVRKIDITKLPPRTKAKDPGLVRAARFLGGGRSLVVAADAHPVRIFDVETGKPIAEVPYTVPDPTWELPPFIKTTASDLVILGGYGGDLMVYDTKTKAERYRLPGIANEYPIFAVSEKAGMLATTAPGKKQGKDRSVFVQLRKLDTGEKVWVAEAEGGVSADEMAFSRDGKQLAVAVNGQVYVYATADKQLISKVLVYPSFGSLHVAFTADGKRLIAGRRHAQLWDIATGKRLHHFGPFTDLLHSVDVGPDGKYLVTGHVGSDAAHLGNRHRHILPPPGEERGPAELIRPS
jgi:outer membrane protein assembly factor BamB